MIQVSYVLVSDHTVCIQFYIPSGLNLTQRKLNTLHIELLYNKALLPKKIKIPIFPKNFMVEPFYLFQLPTPQSATLKNHKAFGFFFTSPENSHLCFPYLISFRQGVLAAPWLLKWFPRNLSTLRGTCHRGRQSRTVLIPLVLSRVNLLSWTFMSY